LPSSYHVVGGRADQSSTPSTQAPCKYYTIAHTIANIPVPGYSTQ
jgi:hypothetical protein